MKHNPLQLLLWLSIGSFLFLLTCCENGESYSARYAQDIDPIFTFHCKYCHGNNGKLDLSSYASLMSGKSNHGSLVVVPGDADNSLLYEAVSKPSEEQSNLTTRMPEGGPYLSTSQIQLIEDWINEGAKDN